MIVLAVGSFVCFVVGAVGLCCVVVGGWADDLEGNG